METIPTHADDLYVDIILALSVGEVLSLPDNLTLEELARRYPETYRTCAETLKAKIAEKTSEIRRISPAESDGT